MDFSQHSYLYNRPSFLPNTSVNDNDSPSSRDVGENGSYPTPFNFPTIPNGDTQQQADLIPYNGMNANQFMQQTNMRGMPDKEGHIQAANYYPVSFRAFDEIPSSYGLDMSLASLQETALDPLLQSATTVAGNDLFHNSRQSISPKRMAEQVQGNLASLPVVSPSERTKRSRTDPPPPLQLDFQTDIMEQPSVRSSEEAQQKNDRPVVNPRRSVRPRSVRQCSTRINNRTSAKSKEVEGEKEKGKEEENVRPQNGETSSQIASSQSAMNASFHGAQNVLPTTKEQRDQEELEQILRQDEDFRRQCPSTESWQGDWQLAANTNCSMGVQGNENFLVQSARPTMESFPTPNGLFSAATTADENSALELIGQRGPVVVAPSGLPMNDPFSTKQQTSFPILSSVENVSGMSKASVQSPEAYKSHRSEANVLESGVSSGHRMDMQPFSSRREPTQILFPHSAPPSVLSYACQPNLASRNSIFSLCPDLATGELGWSVESQTSRFQTSPLLSGNLKFPVRPLIPGVLAKIHNDWLEEYPQPVGGNQAEEERAGTTHRLKRFPSPKSTFESHHIRILWQELERRRILELSDVQVLSKLRQEARQTLKTESAHYAYVNGPDVYNRQDLYHSIPEPSEEQVEMRVQTMWEQTKKSAVYAVGLLRQAEYCIAQGHLGFMPLSHVQRGSADVERNGISGQAAAVMANNVNTGGLNQKFAPQPDVNVTPRLGNFPIQDGPSGM
ncbi:hypothetical protein CBS101457_001978 [Exobasidium rhododendri]|nr:hypothetical protein CBS101457_001978 [Exobasidium rhododendri]